MSYLTLYGAYLIGRKLMEMEMLTSGVGPFGLPETILPANKISRLIVLLEEIEQIKANEIQPVKSLVSVLKNYLQSESNPQVRYCRDVIIQIRTRFVEELSKSKRIIPARLKMLDLDKLDRSIDEILSDNIGNLASYLDQREKRDLDEARKSLLIGNPTATIMTAIRAVEHLLRRWYEKKTGQQVGRKTWGQILDDIGSNYEREKGKLSFLEYLKEKRNKIMHPEGSPTLEEAEYTFHMVLKEAIPMLLMDLKSLT